MMAFNPAKTETIWFQYGEMEDQFVGYTDCVSIMERGAEISVCLKRGN